MPAIENLTDKIRKDSQEKADEILRSAREQAKQLLEEETADARRQAQQMLESAKREAALEAEQIVQGERLAARDAVLAAKRQVLNGVFEEAARRLGELSDEAFFQYLCKNLAPLDLEGQKITLPASRDISLDQLNAFLAKNGGGVLKAGETSSRLRGGFILSKDGIESNYSFDALLHYQRGELESEVLRQLYGEDNR